MKVTLVYEVDYDEHMLGRAWRVEVCSTPDAVGRIIELFTKPRDYHDGPRPFVPHVHREDRLVLIGYRGPGPTFVYTVEKEVHE
jgi:hypothetical protein